MISGFLIDEQLHTWWPGAIRRLQPHLNVLCVGDPGAPPKQTLDPAILEWGETNQTILVTDNRSTLPRHLAEHVAAGHHVPGVFMVDPDLSIHILASELSLIEGASLPDEYQDQIRYVPIT